METQETLPIELERKPEALVVQNPTDSDLLQLALQNNAAIDVIERLVAMKERQRDYAAKVSFDEALNRCQAQLSRISADADNKHTKSRYATYAKIDRVVRPIYTAEGFSISFGERDCPTPGKTRFVAFLSRQGVTREYLKDMTPSTKGPQGSEMMTPIHADASADSYAKRYLLKDIFNIAIGEDDTDGNGVDSGWLDERLEWLANAKDLKELEGLYKTAANEALDAADKDAIAALKKGRDARRRELA